MSVAPVESQDVRGRRAAPDLYTTTPSGLQAMRAPVGLSYAMRFTYWNENFLTLEGVHLRYQGESICLT